MASYHHERPSPLKVLLRVGPQQEWLLSLLETGGQREMRRVVRELPPLVGLAQRPLIFDPDAARVEGREQRGGSSCLVDSTFDQKVGAAAVVADTRRSMGAQMGARIWSPGASLARTPHWVSSTVSVTASTRMKRYEGLI
eukprot:CAMPEP_0174725246 /NCGR_PEP_ID=MMETSP1094-20130205/45130_1 /TAXON_ID=156173 /ORGANISM="Chrysochromulina brevifilum, Strain UTEX LB 985" /LENGTH=139 /DNA_ID=CAMNT_0015926613 /DNA_START=90 /DNA_END=510 /DNA_ORIENTATION=+